MPSPDRDPVSQTTTREKILAALQEQRLASVAALSRQYGLTRADIRYHLKGLVEEGLVEILPRDVSRPTPRGRPQQIFRLNAASAPDNLPELCSALLSVLRASSPTSLQAVAAQMGGKPPTGSPVQRLNAAVEALNLRGYRARWEAHAAGPRILLRSCPYAAILAQHPELCELDRELLEGLTQAPQQQTARMDLSSGRPPACIFSPPGRI
jgi:predicted ArsR family transcriptional regulator